MSLFKPLLPCRNFFRRCHSYAPRQETESRLPHQQLFLSARTSELRAGRSPQTPSDLPPSSAVVVGSHPGTGPTHDVRRRSFHIATFHRIGPESEGSPGASVGPQGHRKPGSCPPARSVATQEPRSAARAATARAPDSPALPVWSLIRAGVFDFPVPSPNPRACWAAAIRDGHSGSR